MPRPMWCKGNGAVEWTGEGAAESRAAGLLGKNFYPVTVE